MSRHLSEPNRVELSPREIDVARLDLLRSRVTTFGSVVGLMLLTLVGIQWWISAVVLEKTLTSAARIGMIAGTLLGLAIILMPRIRRARYQQASLRGLIWRTIWIVTLSVLSQTGGAAILSNGLSQALRPMGFEGNLGPIFILLVFMVMLHTSAAIIVPWTVLEATVPPMVWGALVLLVSVNSTDSASFMVLGVGLTLMTGVPGVSITFFRAGGLRETLGLRLIGVRYAEVERELAYARRLHERLFPKPVREGPIRLEYVYEPMRQIGGDFLDVSRLPDASLLLVMIDVTGHGITAALAVNRLHGELKRLLAENPDSRPATLMLALNRYVFLTLAEESIYATAAAARVWPDGRTLLCVAGHPSPLLRAADGSVSAIEPTAAMLGPFSPDEYAAEEAEILLRPGAALLLYTDGAIECCGASGHCLGQDALARIVTETPESDDLLRAVWRRIAEFRAGSADDDVLIAAITAGHAPRLALVE